MIAQTRARHCRGAPHYFAHPGSALRTFIADDNHIPRLNLLFGDRFHRVLFTLEYARGTRELFDIVRGGFMHPTLFTQITMQNNQTTIGLDRLIERIDHLLTGSLDTRLRGFGNGLTRDSNTVTV